MIKIMIVDDNPNFRKSLKTFLATHPEIDVVGETGDGYAALEMAGKLKPDVVLMDIKMVGMNGLETTQHMKAELPHIRIIILSQYDLEAYREATQGMGASAYVVKKDAVTQLIPIVQQVMQIHLT
jgi:DNA-binding NarL/FixJ family response regulator